MKRNGEDMTTQKQVEIKPILKMPVLHTFMTKKDEEDFSRLINQSMPSVKFIDIYPWKTPKVVIKNSVSDCYTAINSDCALIDTNITSMQDYEKNYVIKLIKDREQYDGSDVGKGLIQLLHSKKAGYLPGGLRNGRLAASYHLPEDSETDFFVKSIWKLFRKHAAKLYHIDPKTGVISDKPISNFLAWPDAIAKYDLHSIGLAFNFLTMM